MKVGVVGPAGLVNKINRIIKAEFPDIEPVNCIYKIYTETPTIIKYQQPHLDAILFAGTTPFNLAKNTIKSTIPWECVPRNGSSLLRVLLEAVLVKKLEIYNVSFDTYNLRALYEAYEEIGIRKERLHLLLADQQDEETNYLERVLTFHLGNFTHNKVTCCITALESVFEKLSRQGIPCLMIEPTANIIRETLKKLILGYNIQVSQHSQLVALRVQVDEPSEYSLLSEDEYQNIIDKMQISKQVYLFAQKIQAAVIEVGLKEYLLFSTRQSLESETHGLESISLLSAVKNHSASTISLGIGFGVTAKEAKHNAGIAMTRASKTGGDMAFIVSDGKNIVGPIKEGEPDGGKRLSKVAKEYLRISEQIGVSINTIFRLRSIVEQYGQNIFTAAELATLFGVTLRSMNRLIEKLEGGGYCSIVGKKAVSKAGRPRRLIQLNIN
jgi:hypothetical protein